MRRKRRVILSLKAMAQKGRKFSVIIEDVDGYKAAVDCNVLLGDDALKARQLLRESPESGAFIILQMICPEMEEWEVEDVEHLVNRTGGLKGGLGEAFRRGLGDHKAGSEVSTQGDLPFS